MSTILHVSDTHFGTEQPLVLKALLHLARDHAPELLVLSGDVTQRARKSQFLAAARFLEQMPVPDRLVLPGNHDIPLFNLLGRLIAPYRNHQRVFGENLEPVFESEELLVIGVNTTRPSRHTVGKVSPEQMERVSRRLSTAKPCQLRIVVTHQPVHITRQSDEKNLLRGREAAVSAWSRAGADLFLSGHIHLPHVRTLRDIFPNLPRPVWSVLAGTALSSRVRGDTPNSVNIIRYAAGGTDRRCTVERWDFDRRDAFVLVASDSLELRKD